MAKILFFYKQRIQQNSAWLERILIWAGIASAVGFATAFVYPQLLPDLLNFLEEFFREVLGEEGLRLDWESVGEIFRSNFQAAVLALFAGVIFGILPVVSVGVNFFVLGLLFGSLVGSSGWAGLGVFYLTVVPHGILEIPAFLLAAAFGLKLGMFWLRPDARLGRIANFSQSLKENFSLLPLLAILLFLAAVVEVFVTGSLSQWLQNME